MSRLYGGQRLVLQAIWESSLSVDDDFVSDVQVAEMTRITDGDVRNWFETLDDEGLIDLVRTADGMRVAMTAKGHLALGRDSARGLPEEMDQIGVVPMIDLLDETKRLGRDPERRMGERYVQSVQPIFARLEAVHESYMTHFREYRDMIAGWKETFGPEHPIFDMLERDHLFTQSDRIRLDAMTAAIPLFREPKEREKLIDPATAIPKERPYYGLMSFLTSIADYLGTTLYHESSNEGWESNRPRGDLRSCLRMAFGATTSEVSGWLGQVEGCRGSEFCLGGVDFSLSPSRIQQLRVELSGSMGDPDDVRRALALAKIDEIVRGLLRGYGKIVRAYEWIKTNRLIPTLQ